MGEESRKHQSSGLARNKIFKKWLCMYMCIQYHKQTRTNIYNCLGISVSDLRVFATLAIRYLSFFVSIFFSFLFPLSLCLVACLSIGLSLRGWIGCLFIFFLIPFFLFFRQTVSLPILSTILPPSPSPLSPL